MTKSKSKTTPAPVLAPGPTPEKVVRILLHSLTRRELARRLQLHHSFVAYVLNGERGISIPVMYRWAEILHMSFNRLFGLLKILRHARYERAAAALIQAENQVLEMDPRVLINGFREPYRTRTRPPLPPLPSLSPPVVDPLSSRS